jgi:hypothetical protein
LDTRGSASKLRAFQNLSRELEKLHSSLPRYH